MTGSTEVKYCIPNVIYDFECNGTDHICKKCGVNWKCNKKNCSAETNVNFSHDYCWLCYKELCHA